MTTVSRSVLNLTILVLARSFAFSNDSVADDKILLRTRLMSSMSFRYDAETKSSQVMSVMGQEMTTEAASSVRLRMTVKDAALDRSQIVCSFSDAASKMSLRGMDPQQTKMDSTIDLSKYDGAEMSFTIDTRGNVISIDRAKDSEASAFVSSMRILDRINVSFPQQEVGVGDSWIRNTSDTTAFGQASDEVVTTMTLKSTYVGMRDTLGTKCWLIETVSTTFDQHGTISSRGIDMELDGSGTFRSRSYVEERTGMIVATKGDVMSDVRMSISGQDAMVIPVDTHLTFSVQRRTGNK
ncbi:MAG: hypothetical protein NTX15_05875 [Candidatus Kapabacteria bacterium]|nr:hypothetical protein [Candidatus Kapabacteria bacterium]